MIPPTTDQLFAALPTLGDGYRGRPGQIQMARAVATAIAAQRPLLVEGGTGVGKSLAYLIPAALAAATNGQRVLIATSHKHLQDQLLGQDLPRVNTLLTRAGLPPVAAATLKGLANYICQVGVEETAGAIDQPAEFPPFAEWLATADHHGEFEEIPFTLPPAFQARLSTDSQECLHKRCPHYTTCWAVAARQRAAEASIVITNHLLLALHLANGGQILPGDYDILIIDEAHAFEEAATRALGCEVSSGGLRRVLHSALLRQHCETHDLEAAQAALECLDEQILRRLITSNGGPQRLAGPSRDGLDLARGLATLVRQLPTRSAPPPGLLTDGSMDGPPVAPQEAVLERLRRRLENIQERLHFCAWASEASHVYFAEATGPAEGVRRPGWTLLAQPVEVSRILATWWAQQPTVICASATLTTGQNSFAFMAGRLGLSAATTLTVPSPFDYPGRVRLVLTPVAGQDQAGHGYYEALARCMSDLLEAAPGKALLLFTSNRALEAVWQRLGADPRLCGWRLLRQGAEPTAVLTHALRSAGPAERVAVCATRSWWQGVDVPGMRLVVIDKLPFPQLGHPLTEARLAGIEQNGGKSFPHYMLPQALITFRQGIGRLMRTERDYGAVAVCDARLDQRAYGRQFMQALPAPVPILRSAAELRAWIAAMEPAVLAGAMPVGP